MEGTHTEEPSRSVAAARFKTFKQEAFSPRMIGFAFSRCWVYVAFFNTALLIGQTDVLRTHDILYIVSLITLVVVLVIGAIANERCLVLMRNKYGIWSGAVISLIGTSSIPFAGVSTTPQLVFLAVAAVATGVGSALLVLFWGRMYSRIGGPSAAAESSVAFILATLPVPLFLLTPFPVQIAVISVLPVASTLVLRSEVKREYPELFPKNASLTEQAVSDDEGAAEDGSINKRSGAVETDRLWHLETVGLDWKRLTWKIALSSLVFGCVVSLMRSVCTNQGPIEFGLGFNVILLASAVCAGGVTLCVLFFSRRLDLAFTYRPVLLFMSLGCCLLPFFYSNGIFAYFFTMAGYICFEIMNWIILSDASFRFEIPSFRIYGFGRASVSGGVLVGAVLGSALNASVDYSLEFITSLSFAMVFIMIVTYTFTLTERDVAKLTKRRADHPLNFEDDEDRTLSLDEKVNILAEAHEITGRGLEVLQLLAKGRTGARIEQELYMSRGTVNTHMRRLYQKLDVHTRQDLLDKLDAIDNGVPE